MTSASECHSCGRCAGQRDAVALSWRSPFAEVLDFNNPARTPDVLTLVYGVLGVATAAFQWTVSPWLLQIKLAAAEWLVDHDHFALLDNDVPWWLLTHHPEASDLFTWLDGALILGYLLGGGFLLGSLLLIGPAIAARLLKTEHLSWQRFALALAPMAAASVILGLSMLTVSHLKAEHFWLGWLPYFRVTLLTLGSAGSLWLAFQLIRHPKGTSCGARSTAKIGQKVISGLAMTFPVGLMVSVWSLVFFVW